MSIRLLNKVMDMDLAPTKKLVLATLADCANDSGISWPSLEYIARRSSVSVRSAQRILAELDEQGLLTRRPRYRADGSQTSSEFLLFPNTGGGDKLSPPSETAVVARVTPVSSRGAIHVTQSIKEPPLNPKKEIQEYQTDSRLAFPDGMGRHQQSEAQRLLADLPNVTAQELLDILGQKMGAGKISKSPIAYLRTLIRNRRTEASTSVKLSPLSSPEQTVQPPIAHAPSSGASAEQERCMELMRKKLGVRITVMKPYLGGAPEFNIQPDLPDGNLTTSPATS